MSDTFPGKRQLVLGILAVASLAVLGTLAVRVRANEECRSAVSEATTPYKAEQVMRSTACLEARHDDPRR